MMTTISFDKQNIEGYFHFDSENTNDLFIEVFGSGLPDAAFVENDWIRTDFQVWPKRVGLMRYHAGFYKGWKQIEEITFDQIKENEVKRVFIFGHSLGAAVAGVGALELKRRFEHFVEVYHFGFGGPRFMYKGLTAVTFNAKVRSKNYRYGIDIVTFLPPWIFGARHGDELIKLTPPKRKFSFKNFMADHYPQRYNQALTSRSHLEFVVNFRNQL